MRTKVIFLTIESPNFLETLNVYIANNQDLREDKGSSWSRKIVKTVLYYDALNLMVPLRMLALEWSDHKSMDPELLQALKQLTKEKILFHENDQYGLYGRQEELLPAPEDSYPRFLNFHRIVWKFVAGFGFTDAIYYLPSWFKGAGEEDAVIIQFSEGTHPKKARRICRYLHSITGVNYLGYYRNEPFRENALSAFVLNALIPVFSPEKLQLLRQNNFWHREYQTQIPGDDKLLIKPWLGDRSKTDDNLFKGRFMSDHSFLTFVESLHHRLRFEEMFEKRMDYYNQWLKRRIDDAQQKNRIV
ncbi:hypothetical protein KFE98_13465 [bacterium SCSIO 12741]|nr:hypothetical protein KFE98_13465 [bacterium SCSIO 12741]